MSAQLQLKYLSLQVLDVGVLEDGKSSASLSISFTEFSPFPASGVHPPKHQTTTVQVNHLWA